VGVGGEVGVLFRDDRLGEDAALFRDHLALAGVAMTRHRAQRKDAAAVHQQGVDAAVDGGDPIAVGAALAEDARLVFIGVVVRPIGGAVEDEQVAAAAWGVRCRDIGEGEAAQQQPDAHVHIMLRLARDFPALYAIGVKIGTRITVTTVVMVLLTLVLYGYL